MTDTPGQEIELVTEPQPPELLSPEQAALTQSGAFTLELPTGHVLRLAHAEPGTIVEVASWTGAGKPGAETHRVMVGLGFEAPQAAPELGADVPGADITQLDDQVVVMPRHRSRWIRPVAWLAGVAVVAVGVWFSPLDVVRPTVGSSIGLGETSSSLVVVLPTDRVAIGQNVVAYLNPAHTSAVLGRVNQVAGDTVLIQTDRAFAQTSTDRVAGQVLVVIPYVGALLPGS